MTYWSTLRLISASLKSSFLDWSVLASLIQSEGLNITGWESNKTAEILWQGSYHHGAWETSKSCYLFSPFFALKEDLSGRLKSVSMTLIFLASSSRLSSAPSLSMSASSVSLSSTSSTLQQISVSRPRVLKEWQMVKSLKSGTKATKSKKKITFFFSKPL